MRLRNRLIIPAVATMVLGATACGEEPDLESGEYPTDDVTILVPYAAGGSTDALARGLAQALGDHLDGNFVVENQPGAGGASAISELLNSPEDGTVLGVLASPTFLIPPIAEDADYSLDEVSPVGLVAEQPIVLIEDSSAPEGFLEDAQTDRKTIGTNGPQTSAGIDVQRLESESELNIEQIPFEGQSELVTNLLGGNLDAITVNVTPDILEGIENEDYRAIATFSPERIDYLPDTPTFTEEGFDMASNATSQFGLFTTNETNDAVQEDLSNALEEVLRDEEVREVIGEQYISDEFVDGEEWLTQLEETRSVYESFFGEN